MKIVLPEIPKRVLLPAAAAGLLFAFMVVAEADPRPPSQIPFELVYNGADREVTLESLGVSAIEDKTGFASVFGPHYSFTWDQYYSDYLLRKLWELPASEDAQFVFAEGVLSIKPEIDGVRFDTTALLSEISSDYPDFGTYEIESSESDITTVSDLEPYFVQVNRLLSEGFKINADGEIFSFPAQQKDFFIYKTTLKDGTVETQLRLNESYVDYAVVSLAQLFNIPKGDLRILSANNPEVVDYVVTEGTISDGRQILEEETREAINLAFAAGATEADGAFEVLYGEVLDETGLNLGEFTLLGSGQTLFARSSWGRAHNIRLALNDHFNNLLIPPGVEFSFNDFLGPIDGIYGWATSPVIWQGALEDRLGGGICQASTTVYRAALDAALEITDQRTHSLYVLYYQEYGDGLDATVYPGEQNLKFINNTPGYLLLRAYTDTENAYVEFWGTDDGRKTTLEGPYTSNNQTDEVIAELGEPLKYYQLGWRYTIEWPDGTVETEWIISSYKSRVEQDYTVGIL